MSHALLPGLAMDIVIAYGARHRIAIDDVRPMIEMISGALGSLGTTVAPPLKPAVPIRRSIQPDYIVCLEDGRKGKLLKSYLRRRFKMTPDQYRAKWGLPDDYPMIAPAYALTRSRLARRHGLGTAGRPRARTPDAAGSPSTPPPVARS
ncbi:MAG: MucR family transcriptional regulator [Proteobacteria bacterium]|nr:MucR family transcriptional regulator [Pseudomonadota bacterium]